MVTLKELEKQRIEKIGSLNDSQIKNYVDILVKDICKLHDYSNVTNPDERLNEIESLYEKLKEVKEITGSKFNNISNYINVTLNADLTIALTVEIQRFIVKDANKKNYILTRWLSDVLSYIHDLRLYIRLLYDLLIDFNEISAVAPDVADVKSKYVDEFKIMILMLKDEIESAVNIIDNGFYTDETIKNDIHELKVTIKNFADSDANDDKLFVEFGLIPILADLIKAYENHAETKKMYIKVKSDIDELFADSDNVFKTYSAERYDDASGISFDEFMKLEPKFNIDSGELVIP